MKISSLLLIVILGDDAIVVHVEVRLECLERDKFLVAEEVGTSELAGDERKALHNDMLIVN